MSKKKHFLQLPKEEVERKDKIKGYVSYVKYNNKLFIEAVDDKVCSDQGIIASEILDLIRNEAQDAIHYIWKDDGCPYDHSGIIIPHGKIDKNTTTVWEFLQFEYTGNKVATYESGLGFSYETYDEKISYDTLDIAYKIMCECVKKQLENKFQKNIPDNEIQEIMEECYDDIYPDSIVYLFFNTQGALEACGVDMSVPLSSLY